MPAFKFLSVETGILSGPLSGDMIAGADEVHPSYEIGARSLLVTHHHYQQCSAQVRSKGDPAEAATAMAADPDIYWEISYPTIFLVRGVPSSPSGFYRQAEVTVILASYFDSHRDITLGLL